MYILNPRLAADIFDNEYIIANLDTGLYYSIQGLAVSLVQALPFEGPAEPIQKLSSSFPGNSSNIENELNTVWKQLLEEEVIKQSNMQVVPKTGWSPAAEYAPSRFNRYADMQDLLMLDPIHEVDEEGWPVKKD